MLKNFNNKKPLPKGLSKEIEMYFTYYWENDKNYVVQDEKDQDILRELPLKLQSCIYKDFLFKDFLESFEVHFKFTKPEAKAVGYAFATYWGWDDKSYSDFMINMC